MRFAVCTHRVAGVFAACCIVRVLFLCLEVLLPRYCFRVFLADLCCVTAVPLLLSFPARRVKGVRHVRGYIVGGASVLPRVPVSSLISGISGVSFERGRRGGILRESG